ncbi:amidohydrolase family protein [Idiomarina sp. HP20-50]|uniref:amidohydrolase family protein n=1 Tax=Idiomarina sp. HP20-50 TaxID=3070813 RepID=UPI00294B3A40|nr:amidohydrolase family protein [Idiomarina sp. HP20-50]MDV6314908.1 amidohydrolase family protein [Idiomarina sp. HP20-50]
MKAANFKKASLLLFIILLTVTAIAFAVMYNQVNRAWGEYIPVVDTSSYERTQGVYAISHANVLSENGQHMVPNQTVLIREGKITEIGSDLSIPNDAELIDGTGKFIIPGLIDAHVHLWQSPNDLLLYLANGVTHIRELNGSNEHLQWREEIVAGRPGPDLFVATRRHNSSTGIASIFDRWAAKVSPVSSVEEIPELVSEIQAEGYDAIKIYTLLNNEHFFAFNRAAQAEGIKILGHIPNNLPLTQLWSSNLKELAHVEELVKALDREFGGYTRDNTAAFLQFVEERSPEIMNRLKENGMAIVSTLALVESIPEQKMSVESALNHVQSDYVNRGIAEALHPSIKVMGWLPEVNIYRLPADYPENLIQGNQRYWKAYAKANQIILQAMREHQVRVLAGTDANVPVIVPGFSMHDELVALTKTGYTPAEALKSATVEAAMWMGLKTGVIAKGYQADLLILNQNPLKDINNTRAISDVISNGRWYSGSDTKNMLKAVRRANQ